MFIVIDSRQQYGKHELKHEWFKSHGYDTVRCKLIFGDYSALNKVYVDTKASMQEIAQNVGGSASEHKRFRNEILLAKAFDKHLYILVENLEGIKDIEQVAYWQNPRLAESPYAITGERLCKAMKTMQARYGVTFLFCSPKDSAEIIVKLLKEDK